MSRTRDRILKAAEEAGVQIEELDWAPLGPDVEKLGREGGWTLWMEPESAREMPGYYGNPLVATNADELIAELRGLINGRTTAPLKGRAAPRCPNCEVPLEPDGDNGAQVPGLKGERP